MKNKPEQSHKLEEKRVNVCQEKANYIFISILYKFGFLFLFFFFPRIPPIIVFVCLGKKKKKRFQLAAVECTTKDLRKTVHNLTQTMSLNSSLQWPVEPSGHSLHFDVIYEGAAPVVRAHLCQNGQSCMKAQQLTGPAPL